MNNRTIISGYAAYDYLKDKFPSRSIERSPYPEAYVFYWFNKIGEIRVVDVRDGTIRVLLRDDEGWITPYTKVRRISSWLKLVK